MLSSSYRQSFIIVAGEWHAHFLLVSETVKHLEAVVESFVRVHCRSDFGGAIITGADFTNALVDKSQQIVSTAAPS